MAVNNNASTQKNSLTAYQFCMWGAREGTESSPQEQQSEERLSAVHSSGGSLYTFSTSVCLLPYLTLITHFYVHQKYDISV